MDHEPTDVFVMDHVPMEGYPMPLLVHTGERTRSLPCQFSPRYTTIYYNTYAYYQQIMKYVKHEFIP